MLRFLIVKTDYPAFLRWLYAVNPGLIDLPYTEQIRVRNDSAFGFADFYSENLRRLGHEVYDIYANNEAMQRAWGREHGIECQAAPTVQNIWRKTVQELRRIAAGTPARHLKSIAAPIVRRLDGPPQWFREILLAQIAHYNPDVLINHNLRALGSKLLRRAKSHVRLLVGQHAVVNGLTGREDFTPYDLIISSFPPTIQYFQKQGIRAEFSRLAFDPRILGRLKRQDRCFDATFVGGLFGIHSSRVAFLESLCARFPQLRIWSQGVEHLPPASPIRQSYMGQAWGVEMFNILSCSKITLNHHGDVGPYANNMRLFEATGVGTLLVTDWKKNLGEMFEIGKEVVAYRSSEECAELVRYYSEHDAERETIARAGQRRTLAEHTYADRAQELLEILGKVL